jgi:hypothetical protein
MTTHTRDGVKGGSKRTTYTVEADRRIQLPARVLHFQLDGPANGTSAANKSHKMSKTKHREMYEAIQSDDITATTRHVNCAEKQIHCRRSMQDKQSAAQFRAPKEVSSRQKNKKTTKWRAAESEATHCSVAVIVGTSFGAETRLWKGQYLLGKLQIRRSDPQADSEYANSQQRKEPRGGTSDARIAHCFAKQTQSKTRHCERARTWRRRKAEGTRAPGKSKRTPRKHSRSRDGAVFPVNRRNVAHAVLVFYEAHGRAANIANNQKQEKSAPGAIRHTTHNSAMRVRKMKKQIDERRQGHT